jgi:hypothetical protein
MAKEVSFKISKADGKTVLAIIDRAKKLGRFSDLLYLHMDLVACHANGCVLNFKKLLNAPDFDFLHDIHGIQRHLDRNTGQLLNCFLPRCARH